MRRCIYLLSFMAGLAALSWEVLWQLKSSLALGVSALGTAITLTVVMGGMCVGALLMGHYLRDKFLRNPLVIYGLLEGTIGLYGIFLNTLFHQTEMFDTWAYRQTFGSSTYCDVLGIVAVLGLPTVCMGATLPILGLVAKQFRSSIAVLYGFNTLGAASGTLIAAFLFIPCFGVHTTALTVALVNGVVACGSFFLVLHQRGIVKNDLTRSMLFPRTMMMESIILAITGFSTFVLEVAWFRSFTAAFHSTTDVFAIMLAPLLIALGLGARVVPLLKQKEVKLGSLLCWAASLILLMTPVVERFDILARNKGTASSIVLIINWFVMTLYVIGPPIFFLGIAAPWILDEQDRPQRWGRLYAINTLSSIVGALGAAWLLLPWVGFAKTAWIAGIVVLVTGLITAPKDKRLFFGTVGAASFFVAVFFESGIGQSIVEGQLIYATSKPLKVLEYYEGPEATVAAIEYDNGGRALIVDGFVAAGQLGADANQHNHYMAWMGHLPMLLHPNPKNALVICFGTGQTANAVRMENPASLDIVDVNPRVYKLAHNFNSNQSVLYDPRVQAITMDGRAYLRRTLKRYDVITLEPMPPNFAGVNALYDKEFYQFASDKMTEDGVIAQWVPFHLVSPPSIASIVKTFADTFPNSLLWIDPVSKTGILLGSKNKLKDLATDWPGLERVKISRDLSKEQILNGVWFVRSTLPRLSSRGREINDDNQLLAYGDAVYSTHQYAYLNDENFEILKTLTGRSR